MSFRMDDDEEDGSLLDEEQVLGRMTLFSVASAALYSISGTNTLFLLGLDVILLL